MQVSSVILETRTTAPIYMGKALGSKLVASVAGVFFGGISAYHFLSMARELFYFESRQILLVNGGSVVFSGKWNVIFVIIIIVVLYI